MYLNLGKNRKMSIELSGIEQLQANASVHIDDTKKLKFHEFICEIANVLCTFGQTSQSNEIDEIQQEKKSKREYLPSDNIRYDQIGHFPKVEKTKSKHRCKQTGCSIRAHIFCIKCKVHLCCSIEKDCFFEFHTKKC